LGSSFLSVVESVAGALSAAGSTFFILGGPIPGIMPPNGIFIAEASSFNFPGVRETFSFFSLATDFFLALVSTLISPTTTAGEDLSLSLLVFGSLFSLLSLCCSAGLSLSFNDSCDPL